MCGQGETGVFGSLRVFFRTARLGSVVCEGDRRRQVCRGVHLEEGEMTLMSSPGRVGRRRRQRLRRVLHGLEESGSDGGQVKRIPSQDE